MLTDLASVYDNHVTVDTVVLKQLWDVVIFKKSKGVKLVLYFLSVVLAKLR